jgi:hypothetical protein
MVSVLAIGPNVRGFKPGGCDGFLRAIKNPQHAFLRSGSETVGPMLRDFTVCKKITSKYEQRYPEGQIYHFFSKFILLCY